MIESSSEKNDNKRYSLYRSYTGGCVHLDNKWLTGTTQNRAFKFYRAVSDKIEQTRERRL